MSFGTTHNTLVDNLINLTYHPDTRIPILPPRVRVKTSPRRPTFIPLNSIRRKGQPFVPMGQKHGHGRWSAQLVNFVDRIGGSSWVPKFYRGCVPSIAQRLQGTKRERNRDGSTVIRYFRRGSGRRDTCRILSRERANAEPRLATYRRPAAGSNNLYN